MSVLRVTWVYFLPFPKCVFSFPRLSYFSQHPFVLFPPTHWHLSSATRMSAVNGFNIEGDWQCHDLSERSKIEVREDENSVFGGGRTVVLGERREREERPSFPAVVEWRSRGNAYRLWFSPVKYCQAISKLIYLCLNNRIRMLAYPV